VGAPNAEIRSAKNRGTASRRAVNGTPGRVAQSYERFAVTQLRQNGATERTSMTPIKAPIIEVISSGVAAEQQRRRGAGSTG